MKIMFICTGNICRSAMAEAMMKKMIEQKNMKDINVYSCGIFADNGDTPTQNAIEVMQEYGTNLATHAATNIKYSNIEDMDLILCATQSHRVAALQLYPNLNGRIYTIKEYAGVAKEGKNLDISDPWGYDKNTYQKCSQEIQECLEKIIEKLQQ